MQSVGAAVMLEERDLTPGKLADTIAELLSDPVKLKGMCAAAKGMAHPNATRDMRNGCEPCDQESKLGVIR